MMDPISRHLPQEARDLLREVETLLEAEGEAQSVRTKCVLCSAINEYVPEALRLVSLETTHYRLQFSYEFFCVSCHGLSQAVVGEETWMRLLDAGVPVRVICEVDECAEIWARREETPLAVEDVLGWVADLKELTSFPDELGELQEADDNERSQ